MKIKYTVRKDKNYENDWTQYTEIQHESCQNPSEGDTIKIKHLHSMTYNCKYSFLVYISTLWRCTCRWFQIKFCIASSYKCKPIVSSANVTISCFEVNVLP